MAQPGWQQRCAEGRASLRASQGSLQVSLGSCQTKGPRHARSPPRPHTLTAPALNGSVKSWPSSQSAALPQAWCALCSCPTVTERTTLACRSLCRRGARQDRAGSMAGGGRGAGGAQGHADELCCGDQSCAQAQARACRGRRRPAGGVPGLATQALTSGLGAWLLLAMRKPPSLGPPHLQPARAAVELWRRNRWAACELPARPRVWLRRSGSAAGSRRQSTHPGRCCRACWLASGMNWVPPRPPATWEGPGWVGLGVTGK